MKPFITLAVFLTVTTSYAVYELNNVPNLPERPQTTAAGATR
jgi:hypothetical protein